MKKIYEIVALERGTDAWLNWRHQGIGKSDAADVMGVGLSFPGTLLIAKKRNKPPHTLTTPEQEEGLLLEPEARKKYEDTVGQKMAPTCVQSINYPWMRSSLDGLSDDICSVIEISCGKKTYFKTDSGGHPPKYIWPQLQHILAVTGLNSIDFWCYRPSRESLLKRVDRDNDYIAKLIFEEKKFWSSVLQAQK